MLNRLDPRLKSECLTAFAPGPLRYLSSAGTPNSGRHDAGKPGTGELLRRTIHPSAQPSGSGVVLAGSTQFRDDFRPHECGKPNGRCAGQANPISHWNGGGQSPRPMDA